MEKSVFIVGRGPNCQPGEVPIVINDQTHTVSNTHCRIIIENEQMFIEDLKSTNGTFVNGNRIAQAVKIDLNSNIMLGKRAQFHLTLPSIQNVLTAFVKKEPLIPPDHLNEKHVESKPLKQQKNNLEYASFGSRFLGFLLDGLIIGFITTPLFIFYTYLSLTLSPQAITLGFLLIIAAQLLITHQYFAVPISKKGYTIGRKAAGIMYLDEKTLTYPSKGKVWLRLFGYAISEAILMIGFLTMLGDSKHQALHDKIAGTIVVKSK